MKRVVAFLYVTVIVCMAIATIVEKYQGTAFVQKNIYGAWWFSLLWAVLTATAVAYFVKRKVRRPSVVLLHAAFVVILAGALLTHLTGHTGMIHLRVDEQTGVYLSTDNQECTERPLPFIVRLDTFYVDYHEGTQAAADYVSQLTLINGHERQRAEVSMNNIYSHRGIRFYQSSYDEDGRGSILSVNSDPWGIPVTYTGYALLFIALLWMLVDPKGRFRCLLRSLGSGDRGKVEGKRIAVLLILVFVCQGFAMAAPPTLPKETAQELGKLYILHNDRVCPLQTFALDFTKKLCGKRSYKGLSAEQVVAGFIFWGDEWSSEPIIKVKGGALRETLQLSKYCAVNTFFNPSMGGYTLGPYVHQYYQGNRDKFHQEVGKVDEKLQLIMELRQGKLLKVFPYTQHSVTWYSPADRYPDAIVPEQQEFMRSVFSLINEECHARRFDVVGEYLRKMQKYQVRYGSLSLPSTLQTKAERLYNAVPFATVLFMVNLSVALLLLGMGLFSRNRTNLTSRSTFFASHIILMCSFLALTLCLALRWIISGNIPMSNGYETMLVMAWMVMLLSLFMMRRSPIMLLFGFLLSGFFLLVSHLSQMDPQITHVMPVLASPLLTLHVSIIMMAYALLSLTFLCGVMGVLANLTPRFSLLAPRLLTLSQLFLYPAIACLGLGIFIGAIWANVSWGTYWSWDPKETWALITLMVYAVAVHDRSIPWLRNPLHYHLFMVIAYLTLLMTYFGVNYFLGGMHSYA